MTLRLRLELQLGQRPTNSTGQLGAGDGTGQWPGIAQLGHNHRAVLQQLQAAMVRLMFIGVGCGLFTGWGAPAAGGAGVSADLYRRGVGTSAERTALKPPV